MMLKYLEIYHAVQPPSTNIDVPVIIDEAFEARKATAVATSLTSAIRPSGILLSTSLLKFLLLKNFFSLTYKC